MKSLVHTGSSNLHSSSYDEDSRVLKVTFKDGEGAGPTWKYKDVPPETVDGLHSADSAGKYFYNNIRNTFKGEPV